MNNLELWKQVSRTNPAYTKHFKKGGFEGTAINAVHLVEMATEKFGPMGIEWGLEILEEHYIDGAPIYFNELEICKEVIHKIRTRLWYTLDGRSGEIFQFGVTTFVGKNKFGIFTDEEAPKKSMTDALTKSLSWLGFAADIHTGLYDDNKYVSEITAHYENERRKNEDKITPEQIKTLEQKLIDTKSDRAGFLAWIGVENIPGFTLSEYERAIEALNRKAEKQKAEKQETEKQKGRAKNV